MCEFLIRQGGHSVFLMQDEKEPILSQTMRDRAKRPCCKAFQPIQAFPLNMLWFSQMRKISARIRWRPHRTTIGLFCFHNIYWYEGKPNVQTISWCLEWSPAMMTLCLQFILPHRLKFNIQGNIKCLEDAVLIWIERVAAGRFYVWQKYSALCLTSRRSQSWLSENFYDHITPNIWLPNSSNCSPFDLNNNLPIARYIYIYIYIYVCVCVCACVCVCVCVLL